MDKTELVEKFKTETGFSLERARKTGKVALLKADYIKWLEAQIPTGDKIAVSAEYLRGLEAKAAAYDRLMSGGKKTLKEWANIFGMYFAVGKSGIGYVYKYKPLLASNNFRGQCFSVIYPEFIDYTGDWKDSLTLPDGWE